MNINTNTKAQLFSVLDLGISLQYKGVSLADLRNFNVTNVTGLSRKYQVHSDRFSQIYNDIDKALDKFMELTKLC